MGNYTAGFLAGRQILLYALGSTIRSSKIIKNRLFTGLLLMQNDVKTAQCFCVTTKSTLALSFIIASFCIFVFCALIYVAYEFFRNKDDEITLQNKY